MAIRKAITFKHITGTQKFLPGVVNKEDLAPRLTQETEMTLAGQYRTVLKLDQNFVARVWLFDEDTEAKLTKTEEKYSQAVKDAIQAKRADQATLALQANEALRDAVRLLEAQGEIKVLDWNYEVDDSAPEVRGHNISELSEIAMADFADRGIEIPDHLKKTATRAAVADKAGIVVKSGLPKEKKTTEE